MPASAEGPGLVLGPLVRYVGDTEATIWVETDRACRVEVLAHEARTFAVAGHHYGLVVVTGLRPGTEYGYEVALDGTRCWPVADSGYGPSVLRTLDPEGEQRLVFGSCRVAERPAPRRRGRRAAASGVDGGVDGGAGGAAEGDAAGGVAGGDAADRGSGLCGRARAGHAGVHRGAARSGGGAG